jgi:hypothetical protein
MQDHIVTRDAIISLARTLYRVCQSTTVFPTILPDGDGGVTAVWYADTMALEILVDAEGESSAILRSGDKFLSLKLNSTNSRSWRNVRGHLGAISAYVTLMNPRWRELVPE